MWWASARNFSFSSSSIWKIIIEYNRTVLLNRVYRIPKCISNQNQGVHLRNGMRRVHRISLCCFFYSIKYFFHDCEAALTSHICYPIRLVFHQHLNSHIAYPGIPPEPSNDTRGQFLHLPSYPLLRLLWSKSNNKVTRKRILDQYHTGTSLSSTALR